MLTDLPHPERRMNGRVQPQRQTDAAPPPTPPPPPPQPPSVSRYRSRLPLTTATTTTTTTAVADGAQRLEATGSSRITVGRQLAILRPTTIRWSSSRNPRDRVLSVRYFSADPAGSRDRFFLAHMPSLQRTDEGGSPSIEREIIYGWFVKQITPYGHTGARYDGCTQGTQAVFQPIPAKIHAKGVTYTQAHTHPILPNQFRSSSCSCNTTRPNPTIPAPKWHRILAYHILPSGTGSPSGSNSGTSGAHSITCRWGSIPLHFLPALSLSLSPTIPRSRVSRPSFPIPFFPSPSPAPPLHRMNLS